MSHIRSPPLSAVPKALRKEIERRGLTTIEAAERIGISRPVFSFILNGHYTLSIETAFKIEAAFHLNARRLLHAQLNEQIKRFILTVESPGSA